MTKQYGMIKDWQDDPHIRTIDDAMNKNSNDEALNDIENAIRFMNDPKKKAHALTHRGVILYRMRDYTGARKAFEDATEMNDSDSDAHYCLAKMNERGL